MHMKNKAVLLWTTMGLVVVALPPVSSILFIGLGLFTQLYFSGLMAIWCAGLLIARLEGGMQKVLAGFCFAAGAFGYIFMLMSWQNGNALIAVGGLCGLLVVMQDRWKRRDFDPLDILLFLFVASSVWVVAGGSVLAIVISRVSAFGAAILAFNGLLKREQAMTNTLDHDLFDEDI